MKRDDMLDFMGGIDDKYLDEAGEMRMNSVVDAAGRSKSIKRRSKIMSLKRIWSTVKFFRLSSGRRGRVFESRHLDSGKSRVPEFWDP